jgi:type III pantothenate kinase
MLLAIDCGNTNVVFAVYDGDERRGQWRAATDQPRTADDYAVWLPSLMAMKDLQPSDITHAIIATVVPQALFDLEALCRDYFSCEPLVVGKGLDLGIEVRMEKPDEPGADRLVNAVAAHKQYGGPAIIVDFGTATTFDIIDEDGAYRGGVISPGVGLSLETLHAAAAQLPRIAVTRPKRVIGGGTVSAMQSGIYWGYVGLIEGLVARIRNEFGTDMKVIATGGLAPLFAEATSVIQEIDLDITMRGLVEIWRRNGGAESAHAASGSA